MKILINIFVQTHKFIRWILCFQFIAGKDFIKYIPNSLPGQGGSKITYCSCDTRAMGSCGSDQFSWARLGLIRLYVSSHSQTHTDGAATI